MTSKIIKARCAFCHTIGSRSDYVWMAHLDYCADCMKVFVSQGWAVRSEGRRYTCTPSGERRFPGLEVVSHCPQDAMPIYRRWIDRGCATEAACPYCLDTTAAMES